MLTQVTHDTLPTGQQIAADAADRAAAAGLSIREMCRRMPMAPSTYHRWRLGLTEPQLAQWRGLLAVLEKAERKQPASGVTTRPAATDALT